MNTLSKLKTVQDKAEAAEYLEKDAEYLLKQADIYAGKGTALDLWLADRVRKNAEHSSNLAAKLRKEIEAA